jgi:hypothetical protein
MSKTNIVCCAPVAHCPKNEKTVVAYVQPMAEGDKKLGGYIRADYVEWILDNAPTVRAVIASARLLAAPAPAIAPVASAPAPTIAPAPVMATGADPMAALAAMAAQLQAMQAALGLSAPVASAPAPVATPAPAPTVAKSSPLASKVRAAAKR